MIVFIVILLLLYISLFVYFVFIHKQNSEGWNSILKKKRLYTKPNKKFALLSDKLLSKKYTSFPTVKVLWKTYDKNELSKIKKLKLPKKYVIKANHGSGMNIIHKDEDINWNNVETKCLKWLETSFGASNGETHYSLIRPSIFIEEYINILYELKIHIFNGEAVMLQHHYHGDLKGRCYYTPEWDKLNIRNKIGYIYNETADKPSNLEDIISTVEYDVNKLGISDYIRYDIIITRKGDVYFGEFTFTPATFKGEFKPKSFELLLGEFLQKGENNHKKIREYVCYNKTSKSDNYGKCEIPKVPNNWLNKYFDKIYVITIPNRLDHVKKAIKELKIKAVIFDAVLKDKLNRKTLLEHGKITSECKLNNGQIACHLSHIEVLKKFLGSDKKTCFIFEDDIKLNKNIESYYSSIKIAMENVPPDWDIINFGTCYDKCEHMEHVDKNIYRSYLPKCRNAYTVTRKGAELILKYSLPMKEKPGDLSIGKLIQNGIIKSYSTLPATFTQDKDEFLSTLGNFGRNVECT